VSASALVSGTVPVSEKGTGTGHLGVGTAVRAVRVVVVVVVVAAAAAAADTSEATATGHWPREWDSNVFSRIRPSILRWDGPA